MKKHIMSFVAVSIRARNFDLIRGTAKDSQNYKERGFKAVFARFF
jgi:hypothetical protein